MPPIARVQTMYIRKVCLKLELAANMAEARRRLQEIQKYMTSKTEYKSAVIYYDVD
jgi:primosomal protein N' (replication factor Y)